MTNTKERMIKLNQEGEYVHFRDIYVPKLGKCISSLQQQRVTGYTSLLEVQNTT